MSEQQELINRIFALASNISLAAQKFVDVRYDGTANQLHVAVITRSGKNLSTDVLDLHEPGETEIARLRITRRLIDVVTHLESLQAKPLQRSLSL